MKAAVSDIQLNAFVDSEMSPAEAAWVVEAIAADPVLAERVAHLHRMKAALAGITDDLPLPEMPDPAPVPRTRWRKSVAAILLLLLGGALFLMPAQQEKSLVAMGQHDQWLGAAPTSNVLELPRGSEWMGPLVRASGLRLVYVDTRDQVTHLGFRGPNACRLSLFVAQSDAVDAPLHLALSEDVQHAHWQTGGVAFEMIARDMAPARFATLATGLQRADSDRQADSALHIALAQSARLRCLG